MKVWKKRTIIICVLIFLQSANVFAEAYDENQVILSWTQDNAHTQTISWKGPPEKQGYVRYNKDGGTLSAEHQLKAQTTEVIPGKYTRCQATIKGLSKNTRYIYQLGDGEQWGEVRTFTTAPAKRLSQASKNGSFEFIYLGDVQYGERNKDYELWGKMIEEARQRNPGIAFGLLGGDMVNSNKNVKDWNLFLSNATAVFSQIPMMTTIGNHETSIMAEAYLNMLALPENGPDQAKEEFYSFDYQDCHITVLNSNFFLENRKAVMEEAWQEEKGKIDTWLEEDLKESNAKWKIVLMHHPFYGISDGDILYDEIREAWEPIFEKGEVDLVLCGHQHIYMRTKEIGGITYVMGNSGKRRSTYYNGENAPEYIEALDATNSNYQIIKVSPDEMVLESYDEEGQIIDKWTKEDDRVPIKKGILAGGVIIIMIAAAIFIEFWFASKRRKA